MVLMAHALSQSAKDAPHRYRPVVGGALLVYKMTLSPVFQACGIHCRHAPSCSEYCAECVSRHGVWAGLWMGLARFQRCRPGGSHGDDPAPTLTMTGARWYLPWRYGVWRVRAEGVRRTV